MIDTLRRVKDLESLDASEKVEFLLMLSEGLREPLERFRSANDQTEELFDIFDLAIERSRLWLRGELADAEVLRYPGYNDDGTDIADKAASSRSVLPNPDIEILGSTITNTVLYAAFLQYKRNGTDPLPHPFEDRVTDSLLVEYLGNDRENYSPALRTVFDRIWEARFRPGD